MCEANTTLEPPEGLIAVDAVDFGHTNGVHDTSDCPQFMKDPHGILQGCKEMVIENMKSKIHHLSKMVVNNNIESKGNGIIVQCTEAWSSERGIINEVYTNPPCFIESEDVNNTKGVCFSSKSYWYSAEKPYVLGLGQSEETLADIEVVEVPVDTSEVNHNSDICCCCSTNEVSGNCDQLVLNENKFYLNHCEKTDPPLSCNSCSLSNVTINEIHISSFRCIGTTVCTAVNDHTAVCQENFHPLLVDPGLTSFVQGHNKCLLHSNIVVETSDKKNITVKNKNPDDYQRGIDVDYTNGSSGSESDEDDNEDPRGKNIHNSALNSSISSRQYSFSSGLPSLSSRINQYSQPV